MPRRPVRPIMGSVTAARKWAANSLPRLIIFAVGLHFLFSAMLAAQLTKYRHRRHRPDWRTFAEEYLQPPPQPLKQLPRIRPSPNKNYTKEFEYQILYGADEDNDKQTKQEEKQLPGYDLGKEEFDELYKEHLVNISQQLQLTLPGAFQVISCRWRHNSHDIYTESCDYHQQKRAQNPLKGTGMIVLFNPLEQERILCDGSRIAPASIRVLGQSDLSCSGPPRLFHTVPTVEAKLEMEPIELRFRNRHNLPNVPCDVPCMSDGGPGVVTRRFVKNTPFTIEFSMEGPHYYNELLINPKAHRVHKYYSTTSFQSEIPLPYFSFEEYGDKIRGTAVKYDGAIKGAVFLARNCDSRNNREELVRSLLFNNFTVHSVGECLHNAEPPDGLTDKNEIMSKYLFSLAFENQVSMLPVVGCLSGIQCPLTLPSSSPCKLPDGPPSCGLLQNQKCENDYITEKLWGALQSGSGRIDRKECPCCVYSPSRSPHPISCVVVRLPSSCVLWCLQCSRARPSPFRH
jgi:Glycosyltransferase family 10 (fucosyltransferase) C-term